MRRLWSRVAVAALGGVLLTACGSSGSSSPSSPSEPAANLQVGLALTPPKMVFIGFYVAQDQGFFAKHHLNITLAGFADGVKSLKGLAGGAVDLGATSSDDVIAAAAQGGGVKSIWSYAAPVDSVMLGGPSVKTAADLKGKTIGITDPGGFADGQARAVLAEAKIPPSQVKFQSFPSRSAFVPALVSGTIDAAVFHVDDGLTAQQKSSNLNVVSKIWQSAPNWWYGAVTVRTDYAAKNKAVLERFIQAMMEADRWMYSHKSAVVRIGTKYTQEDPGIVAQSYDFLAKANEWTVNDGMRQAMVEYTIDQDFNNKQIDKKPKWTDVVDRSFVQDVLKTIGTQKTGF